MVEHVAANEDKKVVPPVTKLRNASLRKPSRDTAAKGYM